MIEPTAEAAMLLGGLHLVGATAGWYLRGFAARTELITAPSDGTWQWYRLLTTSLLHESRAQLAFNLALLLVVGMLTVPALPVSSFLTVYFVGLLVGNLLTQVTHYHQLGFHSLGASGGTMAVVVATLIVFPSAAVSPVGLPAVPLAWVFLPFVITLGVVLVRKQFPPGAGAYFGGAVAGSLVALAGQPEIIETNTFGALLLLLPALAATVSLMLRSEVQRVVHRAMTAKDRQLRAAKQARYVDTPLSQEALLDVLLDKISEKGLEGLTEAERQQLDLLSHRVSA